MRVVNVACQTVSTVNLLLHSGLVSKAAVYEKVHLGVKRMNIEMVSISTLFCAMKRELAFMS